MLVNPTPTGSPATSVQPGQASSPRRLRKSNLGFPNIWRLIIFSWLLPGGVLVSAADADVTDALPSTHGYCP